MPVNNRWSSFAEKVKRFFEKKGVTVHYFSEDIYAPERIKGGNMLGIRDDKLSIKGLYACKCGCGFDGASDELIEKLQAMQDILESDEAKADGINIDLSARIFSGCRCEKHNKDEGGEENSEHTLGLAVDISPVSGSRERYWLLYAAFKVGFNRIGDGLHKNLLHLGIAKEPVKASRVVWTY